MILGRLGTLIAVLGILTWNPPHDPLSWRVRAAVRPASMAGSFALLMVCSITISHPGDQDRPAGTRQGMVRDSAGKPVAGARIRRLSPQISRLCPDPSLGSIENLYLIAGNVGAPSAGRDGYADPGWSASTDAEGRFQGPPSETGRAPAIYLVTADGFAPRLEATDQAPATQVTLDKGNNLVIHLLTDKEEPVGDAQATLVPLSFCEAAVQALEDLLIQSARAGPDGTVEIQNVPDGVYALRLVAKGRASSNLAPLVLGKGHSEFRVRLPQATSFRAALEIPPRTTRSPGTIVAFWNDPAGLPQWTEAQFSSGESGFELAGLPLFASYSFLVRTENGLSSRWVSREELGGSRTGPGKTILLRPPGSWEGRLEEGQKTSPLLIEPVFPGSAPPLIRSAALTVQVGPDGHFVVPEVPPAAERLRIVAPGRGEADVRLKEGTGFDLGVVRIQPRRTIEGSVTPAANAYAWRLAPPRQTPRASWLPPRGYSFGSASPAPKAGRRSGTSRSTSDRTRKMPRQAGIADERSGTPIRATEHSPYTSRKRAGRGSPSPSPPGVRRAQPPSTSLRQDHLRMQPSFFRRGLRSSARSWRETLGIPSAAPR